MVVEGFARGGVVPGPNSAERDCAGFIRACNFGAFISRPRINGPMSDAATPDTSQPYFLDLINRIDEAVDE